MQLEFNKIDDSGPDTEQKSQLWQLYIKYMKPYIEQIWGWQEEWQYQHFEQDFSQRHTITITDNAKICGYFQYAKLSTETYLYMIILDSKIQKKGIGRKILRLLESMQSNKPVKLRCFHINANAQRFYRQQGYRISAKEKDFVVFYKQR